MYLHGDVSIMQRYLANKGYSKEELADMSDERVRTLYEELARQFLTQAQDMLETSEEHERERQKSEMIMPETISLIGAHIEKIYGEIDHYVSLYSVRELANFLLSAMPGVKLRKVEKMIRIKICSLQESWLLELAKNLAPLPEEERDALLEYYSERKDDLELLKSIYEKSQDPNYIEELCQVAGAKLALIREYMPEELESNYKSYYNHSPEKLSAIEKILQLSIEYSRKQLLSMSIKDLQEMQKTLQEKEQEDSRHKALAQQYFERFRIALHDPDDQYFTNVCIDAAMELPRARFQELATSLAAQYKNFHQRFDDVSKEYKDIQNLQIVF